MLIHCVKEIPRIIIIIIIIMTHDKVCTHLHYSICKALGIETADKWYTHMPRPVYEEGDVIVLWNQQYTQTEKLHQIGQI